MLNFKPKKILTTDTDLHLDLLADETKIKEIVHKKLSVLNEATSEDEHVVDALNLEGNNINNLKFQQTEKQSGSESSNSDSDSNDSSSDSNGTRTSGSRTKNQPTEIKNNVLV